MIAKSIRGLAGGPGDDTADEAVGKDSGEDEANLFETAYADSDQEWDVDSGGRWKKYVAPALILVAFVAWTGFFAWTYQAELIAGPANTRIVELIVSWSVPVLLLAACWLLALRHSSAEARRFGDVAALLRQESESLEQRMRAVNAEITMAREFLAQNARELDSVGRQSAKKLVEAAEQIGAALADSDARAKTLETVSNAATGNLEMLRTHLPVVISAAKDAANQIGTAGNAAQQQVGEMETALLNLGAASDSAAEKASSMAEIATESARRISEQLEHSAQRLVKITTSAEIQTSGMTGSLYDAAEMANDRLVEIGRNIGQQVDQSGAVLAGQLQALENAIASLAQSSAQEDERIAGMIARISGHVEGSAARIAEIDAASTDSAARLAFAVSALKDSSDQLGGSLQVNAGATEALIERTERLLLALDSANREINDSLPIAMDRADNRFAATIAHIAALQEGTGTLAEQSDDLLAKLGTLEHLLTEQQQNVTRLMQESGTHFANRHEQVDALASALTTTRSLIAEMNDSANEELVTSLLRVRETTRQAAESSRKILDEELSAVADRLSEQNKAILAEAVDAQIAAMGDAMQQSIERHISLSHEATQRMTEQLAGLDEMTKNLEQRLADTRASFDGMGDESFARQMALLTESLNSAAIDVAKILSNEVTDTAWAAYLKGDRGVFTRRAVKLLDAGEVRTIVAHYDEDAEFRAHVNRYIHDFESMMRVLLSSRDGNAIGVTLLSSDVGKLYVALAQAIERLRN